MQRECVSTAPSGSPADWVNIATYAQTVAQGTYRALGDFQAQDKPGQDAAGGQAQAPQGPAITIILPSVVALPRSQRGLPTANEGQVIDLAGTGGPGDTAEAPLGLPEAIATTTNN